MSRKLTCEFLGTFWLVLGGCGSAVIAAAYPAVGIGLLGVSLAFGLTVLTGAYAFGSISGAHFNPAVTIGLTAAGRFPATSVIPYIVAQTLGAIFGAGCLYLIASGKTGFDVTAGFASNGYGAHSPDGYSLSAGFLAEAVLTGAFLISIVCVTTSKSLEAFAPAAIGLSLTLIHLVSIPVTNTSVNPARSMGPAIFQGGWALEQVWLFWVAPIIGAVVGGVIARSLSTNQVDQSRSVTPMPDRESTKRAGNF